MSVALGIWSGEPVTIFFPPDSGVLTDPLACPENAQELLNSLFQSPQYLPAPGSLDAAEDASPVYEELPRIPAGTVLKLEGLKSCPDFNGQRVVMLARGLTRYHVRLLDTGKKLLVCAANLVEIDPSDPLFSESNAASKTWSLMNRLYNTSAPKTGSAREEERGGEGKGREGRKGEAFNSSAEGRGSWDGAGGERGLGMGEVGGNRTEGGGAGGNRSEGGALAWKSKGYSLTDADLVFLKNLNIPVVDKEHFWETMHCDGGLGRYTFFFFLGRPCTVTEGWGGIRSFFFLGDHAL
jgi:hypothetical protein